MAGNKKGQRGKKEVVNGADATGRTRNEKRRLTGSEKESSNPRESSWSRIGRGS